MGSASSKQDDPLQSRLVEDPELQNHCFPNDEGHRHNLRGAPRVIGYEIYGNEACSPERTILFMHGTPGTRFFFSRSHAAYAATNNVRVLIPERPGFGLSTPFPQRTLQSTVLDITSLLDELNLERVHVVGYSAGGPYALAFARWHPDRCTSVAVISSLSPNMSGVTNGMSMLSKVGYSLSARYPALLRLLVRMMVREALAEKFRRERTEFTKAENETFSKEFEIRRLFAKSTLELYSRDCGSNAESEDYVLMAKDWGFRLNEIKGDFRMFVYGAEEDNKCTTGMYQILIEGLPSEMLTTSKGKGEHHLWFYKLFEQRLFADIGLSREQESLASD